MTRGRAADRRPSRLVGCGSAALRESAGKLVATYVHRDPQSGREDRLEEIVALPQSLAQAQVRAADLFDVLFPGNAFERVRRAWFNGSGVAVTPRGLSLRVRLQLADPRWTRLPWRQLVWQRERLVPGWSVELWAGEPIQPAQVDTRAERFCFVVPRAAEQGGHHGQALCRLVQERVGAAPDAPCTHHAATHDRLQRAGFVYIFAQARVDQGRLQIQLDANASGAEWVPLEALLAGARPDVLFLNLLFGQEIPDGLDLGRVVAQPLLGVVNLVFARSPDHAYRAREAAQVWWAQVLEPTLPVDPMRALADSNLGDVQCWTRYSNWSWLNDATRGGGRAVRAAISRIAAYLVTDRIEQRAQIQAAVNGFDADDRHRVLLLVGYGEDGNLASLLGEQAEQFIVERSHDAPPMRRHMAEVPTGVVTVNDLAAALRHALGSGDLRQELQAEYERGRSPDAHYVVVMVDWRVPGVQEARANALIDTFAKFSASRELLDEIPDTIRLVQVVGLECPSHTHVELKAEVDRVEIAYHDIAHVVIHGLPPLAAVSASHIARAAERLGADRNTAKEFGVVLSRRTGGRFKETVEWLDRGHRNWSDTLDKLRSQSGDV